MTDEHRVKEYRRQLIDKINSHLPPLLSLLDGLQEVTENLGNSMNLRLSKCKKSVMVPVPSVLTIK